MKKVLALLIVSILILLLAACGNNQSANAPEATVAVTEQETAATEQVQATQQSTDSTETSSSTDGDKVNVEALKKIEESDPLKVKVTKKEIQEDAASGFSTAGNDLIILHITNNDSKPVSDVSLYILAYDDNNIAQTITTGTFTASFGNSDRYIKGFTTKDITIEPGETSEVAIKTTKGKISGIRCIVDSYKMDGQEIENKLTTEWYKQAYVGKHQELD